MGRTPLHFAAKLDYTDMAKVLLKHKVNLSKQDKKGFTPSEVGGEWVNGLIEKAKRLELISKMGLSNTSRLNRARVVIFGDTD